MAVVLCLVLPLSACTSPPDTARVIQVIDGDTIAIEGGYRVRYIGIDTPEIHPQLEAFGAEAWQANRQLVGQGLAVAKAYPPDTKYQDLLAEMERQARLDGKGMWAK